jgi:hypothetical protein
LSRGFCRDMERCFRDFCDEKRRDYCLAAFLATY